MCDAINFPLHFPVACHTDNVGPGSTFVAVQGMNLDGVQFIPEAIKRGATTIVLEHTAQVSTAIEQIIQENEIRIERVDNARLALAHMSAQAAGYPAKHVQIIGVTGTKGKTTTTFLLEHLFRAAGYKTALISSIKNSINGHDLPTPFATPLPDYLHQFLRQCVDHDVDIVLMEVAAQAVSLHRVADIAFDGLIFTNFSLEHLEFYTSMETYFDAKAALFKQAKAHAPLLINADDVHGQELLAAYPNAIAFGMHKEAIFKGTTLNISSGLALQIMQDAHCIELICPTLLGDFNAYNVLAAVSMALSFNINAHTITHALTTFPSVPGRLQQHALPNGAVCFIDYAHNPSSYQAVLSLLKSKTDNLIVIFGAGGKRDPSKRPIMGAIAAQYADIIFLTSDNPRDEDPAVIIEDIARGIDNNQHTLVMKEVDRECAIRKAYTYSQAGTIIAILGKGINEYQIIADSTIPFSERKIIESL